jgi:hypothetical protein
MIGRAIGAVAMMLCAASCGKPIRCDARGVIITPANASFEDRMEYNRRNSALLTRQTETQQGGSVGYTRESLQKAEGCP